MSLVRGVIPAVLTAAGLVALALLLARRTRSWWLRWVPLVVAVVAAVVLVGNVLINNANLFPDQLPISNLVWLGVGLLGLGLAVARLFTGRWWARLGALGLAVLVVLAAAAQINRYWGEYTTLGALKDAVTGVHGADFGSVNKRTDQLVVAPPGKTLAEVWHPPPGMPAHGTVTSVPIPGTTSGFSARPAWLWLPPAALTTPKAELPLLVLSAGQPGSPEDWISAGGVPDFMDAFAAAHHGLAPVVLVPDTLGSYFANPMCLDSRLGNAQTYLTRDVPDWVQAHLQVTPVGKGWAFGGYSYGGTCSLQMALNAPRVYPNFIDVAGQDEPTLGTRRETVDKAFGGDAAAFARVNPLDLLASQKFPTVAGAVVGGTKDATYLPQQRVVYAACQRNGLDVRWLEIDGGHDWTTWRGGIEQELPWLAARVGLT